MGEPNYDTPESIRDFALERFARLGKKKYDVGQTEHGGLITDRKLFDELEEEIIDMYFYLTAIRIKHHEIVERAARQNMDLMGMAIGKKESGDHPEQ